MRFKEELFEKSRFLFYLEFLCIFSHNFKKLELSRLWYKKSSGALNVLKVDCSQKSPK